jgi:hypothetical protein
MTSTIARRTSDIGRPGQTSGAVGPRAGRGFTLIETALATIIVGVGILAMVSAQQAFHQQNNWSTHASIGERLGNEIREMTLILPRHDPVTGYDPVTFTGWGPEDNEISWEDFDDLDDWDGAGGGLSFGSDWDDATVDNGPINARRQIIENMPGWEQIITVHNVNPFNINGEQGDGSILFPLDGMTGMIMVEVLVRYTGPNDPEPTDVTTVSWIAPNSN